MRVDLNHRGIAEMAKERGVRDGLLVHARRARTIATTIAPSRSNHYRMSLFAGRQATTATFGSRDFKAWWIEFGTSHPGPTPAHHILVRAAKLAGMRVKEAKRR